MNPHLVKHPVDAVLARLRAEGDAEAARVVGALRDAIVAQDEALRDLVSDAHAVVEEIDGTGSQVDISCAEGGFDKLLRAFGYEETRGTDHAALDRARATAGGPEAYDGAVFLSPLDHLEARISTESDSPERLLERGFIAVEVARPGGGREIVYHDPSPRTPAPAPAR